MLILYNTAEYFHLSSIVPAITMSKAFLLCFDLSNPEEDKSPEAFFKLC